ncbi:hypothetical protein Dsin_012594 [Dipteronia sinensis]|uniref:MULE transposase domain-containing protein n=1 Tax=Dipteronia sinensis TaxID=43782 RepID=A0AAE0AJJ0_9ROSI|nr:hypothetical protein Dsin_012594 [Dipteronia sinensis]
MVSGSNNPLGSHASPGFTSIGNDQATPASTTKYVVVDDNDSSESIDTLGRSDSSKTSDIEDEIDDDDGGQPATEDGTEERGVSGTPNSFSPSMNTRWTVSGSELYSIKAVRSVDVFEKSSDQGPIYKGQMFKDKPTLKRVVGSEPNPRIVAKIKTDSKNRPVICIDTTHLKARTRGVLLVAVCKDGNEMIYHLAFGFANSECTESWTWFLKKLHKLIQYSDRVMLVSDRHTGIFNATEAIFPDAAHGICAYHLAQNLKRFCKQWDDVIWLYYRATYAYRIEEFDRVMNESKETYRKVYNELLGAGVEKFSLVHSPRKRIAMEEKESARKTKEVEDTICWGEKKVTIVFKVSVLVNLKIEDLLISGGAFAILARHIIIWIKPGMLQAWELCNGSDNLVGPFDDLETYVYISVEIPSLPYGADH